MKAFDYTAQSLAATGFAILDGEVAHLLRPDLWHDATGAGHDLLALLQSNGLGRLREVHWGTLRLAGRDRAMPIAVRGFEALAERVEAVTGRRVLALGAAEAPRAPVPAPVRSEVARDAAWVASQRIAKLRALAAQELPAHGCTLRSEILRARDELARLDQAAA